MKKRITISLLFCMLLLCLFALGGCGNEEVPDEVLNKLVEELDLRVDEENLRWNNVVNATGYTLYVNDVKVKQYGSDETLFYEYDKTENDYTAKVEVKGEKITNFTASVQYGVKKTTAEEPEVFANSVRFAPCSTKIYFRIIPSVEWKEVNESNYIDFSSYTGGTVEYEYYVQGTGFDKTTNVYYTDSAVGKGTVKIKTQLQSVSLSADGNKITWDKVEGAASYTVITDGEQTITTERSVSFSETEGEHTVYVYANPQDENLNSPSDKAYFQYNTQKQSVDTFTVDDDVVTFEAKKSGVLRYKDGEEWKKAYSVTMKKENLSVKFVGYYDADSATYYTESKVLSFRTGEKMQILFDKTGYLNLQNDGKGVEVKLYQGNDIPDEYSVIEVSEYYIGNCEGGKTYKFESKFSDYINRGVAEDVYYEFPANTLEFYTLPAPDLKIRNGKVVWTIDNKAESYVYGTEEGEMTNTTTEYFTAEETADRYFVQAVGSDERNVLNSHVSSVDATRWALTSEQLKKGYDFSSARNIKGVATGSSSILAEYDENNNAMKITPIEANKEVLLSVDSDDVTLKVGDAVIVKAFSVINVGFRVNGKWKMTLQEKNGSEFKEYVFIATEEIKVREFGIMPYTKFGELYVSSIRVFRSEDKSDISVAELEKGFPFDSTAKILEKTTCQKGIETSYDAATNSMLIKPTEKNKSVTIGVESFTLNKGDKIVVKAMGQLGAQTASFITVVNGNKQYVNINTGTEFGEYEYEANEQCSVTGIQFVPYTASGSIYVKSIQIVKKSSITISQLETGYVFDGASKIVAYTACEKGLTAGYDEMKNAMKVTLSGTQNLSVSVSVDAFTLNKGDKIVVKALSAINTSFLINGAYKMTLLEENGTDFKEYEWVATENTDVNALGFKVHAKNGELYLYSIKVVRA